MSKKVLLMAVAGLFVVGCAANNVVVQKPVPTTASAAATKPAPKATSKPSLWNRVFHRHATTKPVK